MNAARKAEERLDSLSASSSFLWVFRVGDLRYLQAMTGLRTVRLAIQNCQIRVNDQRDDSGCLTPIRGIVESLPPAATFYFGTEKLKSMDCRCESSNG